MKDGHCSIRSGDTAESGDLARVVTAVKLSHVPRSSPPPLPAPDLAPASDPGFDAASTRAERALATTPADVVGRPIARERGAGTAHEIRIGTASWTDPTMVRGHVFYPRGISSAEDRLRFYAEQFSVVEVDSTYYSLPDRTNAERWTERTPPHFSFHIKAHALMTGQPTEVARLPEGLVEALPAATASKKKIYAKDLPPELLEAVWTYFIDRSEEHTSELQSR